MGSEKEAEPLLKEAILLPDEVLSVDGDETRQLAAKLALDLVPSMKVARWELACSLDGAALFEALQHRFSEQMAESSRPHSEQSDPRNSQALTYYFLHLVATGKSAAAVEIAETIAKNPSTGSSASLPLDALEQAGPAGQVCDFLHDLLAKHPELPFWNDYIALAAKAGKTAEMLTLIRSVAGSLPADQNGPQEEEGSARRSFYLALLSAGQIEEGVAELRKIIAATEKTEHSMNSHNGSMAAADKEIALARLGQLLGRPDLLEEGIAAAKKIFLSGEQSSDSRDEIPPWQSCSCKPAAGRRRKIAGPRSWPRNFRPGARVRPDTRKRCLATLVRVYYLAGRPDDVLAGFQRFSGWGAVDLSDVLAMETDGYALAEFHTHAAGDTLPVGYMAAWALAQRGKSERALKIADALLDRQGGFDPAFELLTKLSGQQALARLDQLAARDRFEERPLIWKAQLQLDAGQLDDAEKTIRAAIDHRSFRWRARPRPPHARLRGAGGCAGKQGRQGACAKPIEGRWRPSGSRSMRIAITRRACSPRR